MIKPLISEIYDIMQNVDCSQDDWKRRVADYLVRSNPTLPQITNQCQVSPDMGMQEKGQQTTMTYKSVGKDAKPKEKSMSTSSILSSSSPHSSLLLTTTSCVTCSGFDHTEPCISELDLNKRVEPQSDEPVCVDEEIIWKEIVVYEEEQPEEEEEQQQSDLEIPDEHGQEGKDGETDSECDEPANPPASALEMDFEAHEEDQEGATAAEPEEYVEVAEEAVPTAEQAPPAVAQLLTRCKLSVVSYVCSLFVHNNCRRQKNCLIRQSAKGKANGKAAILLSPSSITFVMGFLQLL